MSPRIPRNSRRAAWPWRHTLNQAIGASRQERGTVLLMVVGVLALLAIIGVVYATIGRADRSASVTVQRQQRITDQSEEIAAYVAKVIGDATFARYVERTETAPPGENAWKYRTRGYTYPWTDEHFLSVAPTDYATANNAPYSQALPALAGPQGPAAWYSKFSPTGDNIDPWQGAGIADAAGVTTRDPRNHADPYLAVLEPEWLHLTPANPNGALFSIRDWRHISNLSPSGNFVNLANLRRSNNGGFDAPPGFRIGTTTNLAQMSYGLTLRNPANGQMYAPGASTLLPDGTVANPANPAHWANNQIYAYQPAVDGAHDPSQYEYVLNQWCDTDGDGFLDARWFELTDLSTMFGTGGTSAPRQLISTRGRVRLFCAARVIDSSAKINVNVASDIIKGAWPNTTFTETFPSGTGTRYLTRDDALPPGLTPADIALNRVLKLSDMNQTLSRLGTFQLGYGGLPQPSATAYDGASTNYTQYNTNAVSDLVGNASYSALASARKSGSSAVVGVGNQPGALLQTTAGDRFDQYDLFSADPHSARNSALYQANATQRVLRSPFDLSDELELISFFGVNDSSTLSRLEATVGGRVNNAAQRKFSPLRDNRSRALEMAGRDELDAAGMFSTGGAGEAALLAAYTDVRHLLTTVNGSRPMKDEGVAPDPARFNPASTDVSAALKAIREYGEIDPVVPATDPTRAAKLLARNQGIQLIFKLYANALAPYTDVQEFPSAWDGTTTSSQARRGLIYGGNAELALRVAAHMTANLVDAFDRDRRLDPTTGRPFLTASTTSTDGLDRNDPTRVALNLVQVPNGTLPGGVQTDRLFQDVAELNHNAGFNTTPSTPATTTPTLPSRVPLKTTVSGTSPALPSSTQYPSQVGKMTIFGIEPQPFLTEYGVMALYTDAPNGVGSGDDDGEGGPVTPLVAPYITIKMKPVFSNSDFICEVIAFQLNNPFSQDLVLYDPTPANIIDKHKFYIELAGRYYAFRPQDTDMVQYGANNVVLLKAGKTRTFYAVNPGTLKAIGERIRLINVGSRMQDRDATRTTVDDFRDLAKNWIEDQLRKTGSGITDLPLQLTQMDPRDFQPIVPSGGVSDPEPDMNLWGEPSRPQLTGTNNLSTPPHSVAERRVCNLWRTVRARASVSASANDTTGSVNDLTNDILTDRMHDPSDPTTNPDGYLFAEREQNGGANQGVSGASGGDDHASDADVGANTGYTAVVWASVRRPTDVKTAAGAKGGTLDSTGRPIRGVLPPWCLEARSDSKWTSSDPNTKFGLNKRFNGSPNDQGNDSDYPGPSNARFKKLKLALASNTAVNEDIALPCAKKANGLATGTRANPIGQTKETTSPNYKRDYSQVAVEFHAVGEDALGGAETDTAATTAAIRRSRNPALFSRSGDFLLPLAVGPWFDPSRQGTNLMTASANASSWITSTFGSTTVADREASWMTLSEALALSCGYYSPQDPNDPFFEFGNFATASGPNPEHPPKADRGHLVLNAFTPYLKKGTAFEQPLGSGVPFALSIIDQFRAASGISSTPKNIGTPAAPVYAPEQQTREVSYGGGSTSVAANQTLASLTRREGVPNLNTLSLNTIRAIPFITPEDDASSFMQSADPYYSSSGTGVKLFDRAVSEDYDIAPTIKSYRDRSLEQYRQLGALTARSVDFTISPTNPTRTQKTQLGLITDRIRRESLGFKSLGEIAAVNVFRTGGISTQTNPILDPNSIFRFGELDRDATGNPLSGPNLTQGLSTGMLGTSRTGQRIAFQPSILSSRAYNLDLNGVPDKQGLQVLGNGSALHYPLGGNELPNGYQEKLAIVNAMTNTVAVRSDVFTVYFVIHGYTPDDCDVEGTQPLVPSVAKRYVMIVDRSNMASQTDKPRILMLKEVPVQ